MEIPVLFSEKFAFEKGRLDVLYVYSSKIQHIDLQDLSHFPFIVYHIQLHEKPFYNKLSSIQFNLVKYLGLRPINTYIVTPRIPALPLYPRQYLLVISAI